MVWIFLPVEVVDGDAVGDQGPAVDLAAARRDGDPVRVVHALLGGELGLISQNSSGCSSESQGIQRLIAPLVWCSVSL